MSAPTIEEPPELPTFPSGPGLPDQPGVFIPKFLAFLAWFTLFRAYLVDLIAYFEGLASGSGSGGGDGVSGWFIPLVDGSEPPNLITDGAGKLILVAWEPE